MRQEVFTWLMFNWKPLSFPNIKQSAFLCETRDVNPGLWCHSPVLCTSTTQPDHLHMTEVFPTLEENLAREHNLDTKMSKTK